MTTLLFILLTLGCSTGGDEALVAPKGGWANVAPARVEEVLKGDGNVYLQVKEGQWTFWVATAEQPVKVGDYLLLGKGPEKKQYLSADLERRFKVMTLIDDVAVVDKAQSLAAIRMPVPKGGISIADLYAKRTALAGTEVIVRGRIVKANKGIFDTNWYHLQDGTGSKGTNDLTVTSSADAKVGDLVVARGSLTIDKDLGFGYFYDAIVEDGTVTVEKGP